jgi:hypothetical protein
MKRREKSPTMMTKRRRKGTMIKKILLTNLQKCEKVREKFVDDRTTIKLGKFIKDCYYDLLWID